MKQKICFEVANLGVDDDGNRCPVGLSMEFDVNKEVPFEFLKDNIKLEGVLKMACLDSIATVDDVKLITEEEYEEKYGDEE